MILRASSHKKIMGGENKKSKEDEEERLLRKAKEYIIQQQQQQQQGETSERHHHDKKSKRSRSRKRNDNDDYSNNKDDDRKKRHKRNDRRDDNKRRRRSHKHEDDEDSKSERRNKHRKRKDDEDDDDRKRKHNRHHHHHRDSKNDDDRHDSKKRKGDSKKTRKDDNSSRHHHRKKHHKDKSKRSGTKKAHRNSSKNIKNLIPLGPIRGQPPTQLLEADADYFQYHQQLWVYLYRNEGLLFNDLPSTQAARDAFERFVQQYNAGQLEQAYYDDNDRDSFAKALEECKTTQHAWSFQTTEQEKSSLVVLQEGVRKQTEFRGEQRQQQQDLSPGVPAAAAASKQKGEGNVQLQRQRPPSPTNRAETRHHDRVANRRLKEHIRAAEEEFTGGRKEGRERQIEKRKELSEKIHGSSRDRGDAAAVVELNDQALYGGDEMGFQDALQREKARKARREEQRRNRLAELEQKDKEKQAEMLKKLGLTGIKPGQKITIAPRKDDHKKG